jgi:hypothetical protein
MAEIPNALTLPPPPPSLLPNETGLERRLNLQLSCHLGAIFAITKLSTQLLRVFLTNRYLAISYQGPGARLPAYVVSRDTKASSHCNTGPVIPLARVGGM